MRPIFSIVTALAILGLTGGAAGETAEHVAEAMDLAGWSSLQLVDGSTTMMDVRPELGVIQPQAGEMALLYSGKVSEITGCMDDDMPPEVTEAGDTVELRVRLLAPPWAHSFSFHSYFLSREYPDYVGSQYNDAYTVTMDGRFYEGNIVFDGANNVVDVNSVLFVVTNPSALPGTGYDGCDGTNRGGGTGWLTTVAPVYPGEELTLTFRIGDVADGIYDSAVLIDGFAWHESGVGWPCTAHMGDDACGETGDGTGDGDEPGAGDDEPDDAAADDDDDAAADLAGADEEVPARRTVDTFTCGLGAAGGSPAAPALLVLALLALALRRAPRPR